MCLTALNSHYRTNSYSLTAVRSRKLLQHDRMSPALSRLMIWFVVRGKRNLAFLLLNHHSHMTMCISTGEDHIGDMSSNIWFSLHSPAYSICAPNIFSAKPKKAIGTSWFSWSATFSSQCTTGGKNRGDEGESLTKRLILLSFGQYSIHLETESY